MISEHENLRMVNRVLTPPPSPALIRPGTAHRPEHISAHNPRTYIVEAALGKVVVDPGLSTFVSEHFLLKGASRHRPSMKGIPTDSHWVL